VFFKKGAPKVSAEDPPSRGDSDRPSAQKSDGETSAAQGEHEDRRLAQAERQDAGSQAPDVLLDVPVLKVEEITLTVEGLRAHVAVLAELADLVKLSVGADVELDKVELQIKGVEAQALLKVRLDQVRAILDKALTTIGENPEILQSLVRTVDRTVGEVGGAAREAVGEGGAVSRLAGGVGEATQQVGDAAGHVVGQVGREWRGAGRGSGRRRLGGRFGGGERQRRGRVIVLSITETTHGARGVFWCPKLYSTSLVSTTL
jgi:hypothetical protein